DAVGVDNAVLAAELWNPATETWTTLAAMQRPRLYHSNALLLADARVLVLGGGRFNGGNAPTDQLSSEIFSPPYLFKGARPVITAAPSTAAYGSGLSVQTPDAASIGSVVLIRLGTVTHSFNTNQRIVPLQFSAAAGTLSVQTRAARALHALHPEHERRALGGVDRAAPVAMAWRVALAALALAWSGAADARHSSSTLDPRRATPGVSLELVESARSASGDAVKYRLRVKGLPEGHAFGVWTKGFGRDFTEVVPALRDDIELDLGPYPRGAAWWVAVASED